MADPVQDLLEDRPRVGAEVLAEGPAQHGEEAAQARVLGHRAEEGFGLGETLVQVPQRVAMQVQEPMLREERTAARLVDGLDHLPVQPDALGQGIRHIPSLGRGFGLDHHHDVVGELGEGPLQLALRSLRNSRLGSSISAVFELSARWVLV